MPVQISIGSTYICHKPNASTTRSCVVLSSRTISLPPPSPPIRELYVSYPGLDKRLDEWIAESLIVSLVTPPLPNPPCSDASPAIAVAGAGASFPSAEVGEKEEGDLAVGKAKTKTELRHEKERRSLAHELSGFRKRKREPTPPPLDASLQPAKDPDADHHQLHRVRNFPSAVYHKHSIQSWYFSPYPISANEDPPLPPPSLSHSSHPPSSSSSKPASSSKAVTAAAAAQASDEIEAVAQAQVPSARSLESSGKIPGLARTTLRAHGRTSDLLAGGLGGGDEGGRGELFVCDGCFKYMRKKELYTSHKTICKTTHPPGRKVYSEGERSIWEVDGADARLYCQNLSLFGKLFIDQKTIFYSVEAFVFYVLTIDTPKRHLAVGFFSKEKVSYDDYNLAVIVTFPPYQKQAYGRLLMEFSYRLTLDSPTPGTPERPLSDLGLKGYLAFWTSVVVRTLQEMMELLPNPPTATTTNGSGEGGGKGKGKGKAAALDQDDYSMKLSVASIAKAAHLLVSDVTLTLQECGLLRHRQRHGRHSIDAVADGDLKTFIVITRELVNELARERKVKPALLSEDALLL